jgi:uncharacterized protein (DUF1015 family)
MAEITAFRGVRFAMEHAQEAAELVCPPYDVIGEEERCRLEARHPHNIVRLELPRPTAGDTSGHGRYVAAASLYRHWLAEGVLRIERSPCLYVYGQRYGTGEGTRERLGVLAALKVEPFEARVVLPHKQTFSSHKEDRYRLLSAASAQFSPIFGLYSAPGSAVRVDLEARCAAPPAAAAMDTEGVEHRLWAIDDPAFHRRMAAALAGHQIFIADGHHRYETALRLRTERGSGTPADYVMTFLVEMEDPGLVVLPTHRLLSGPLALPEAKRRLQAAFDAERVDAEDVDRLRRGQLGLLAASGEALRLTLRDAQVMGTLDAEHSAAWRNLDVVVLHRLALGQLLQYRGEIAYTRDADEARRRTLSGEFSTAWFVPAPSVQDLRAVAGAGERMPEKSTYFWPKAITGLVVYPLGTGS